MGHNIHETGHTVLPAISLDAAEQEQALKRTVMALRFIVLHKAEDVRNRDVNHDYEEVDESLAVGIRHRREDVADNVAPTTLQDEEPESTIAILFEIDAATSVQSTQLRGSTPVSDGEVLDGLQETFY